MQNTAKVLLADANEEFRTLLAGAIRETGEFTVVGSTGDGLEALRLAEEQKPDLLILDTVLPGLDGFGILRRLPELGAPKAIVLSGYFSDRAVAEALELGAADVMSRPLDIAELVARIRAAQARTQVSVTGFDRPPVSFGGLTVDISKYRAELDGEPLNISPKETALLYLLISSPDTVFSREELSRQLRSSGHASERTVNVFISRLKKAIGRYSANIVSVRGVGYKFDGSVE